MPPEAAAEILSLEDLMAASAEDEQLRDENALLPSLKAIRAFIRDDGFAAAGRIYSELKAIAPDGARIADMPDGLGMSADEIAAGVALLDQYGALEFIGDGAARAARIEKGMLACL